MCRFVQMPTRSSKMFSLNTLIYHIFSFKDIVVTSSPDTTVRVWNVSNSQCSQIIRVHADAVTGLSLHATGDYVLSTGTDEHWAFSDIRTGRVLTKVSDTCSKHYMDICMQKVSFTYRETKNHGLKM